MKIIQNWKCLICICLEVRILYLSKSGRPKSNGFRPNIRLKIFFWLTNKLYFYYYYKQSASINRWFTSIPHKYRCLKQIWGEIFKLLIISVSRIQHIQILEIIQLDPNQLKSSYEDCEKIIVYSRYLSNLHHKMSVRNHKIKTRFEENQANRTEESKCFFKNSSKNFISLPAVNSFTVINLD